MTPQKIRWQPTISFINNLNLKGFENWLGKEKGLFFNDYDELWQWSKMGYSY